MRQLHALPEKVEAGMVFGGRFLKALAERADHALGPLSPNLFAYQRIFVLTIDA
jgi:hypothetical protein